MKRDRLPCLLLALLLAGALPAQTVVQVAPTGDDRAAGTAAAPLRTLTRARDRVRELKRAGLPAGGIRVELAGGTYRLDQTLTLTAEDSGAPDAPIVWTAAAGQTAVLSGGRPISGWKRRADGVFEAPLPAWREAPVHRQLFVDGRRYRLARSPNEWQYRAVRGVPEADGKMSKAKFVYAGDELQPWPNLADVSVHLYFSWISGHFPLKSVDPATRVVELAGPAVWSLPYVCRWWQPYLVENHPGALDVPGEFQYDRAAGVLRVIPWPGQDLVAGEVVAPELEQLVDAVGNPEEGRYVEHVHLVGLTFADAAWSLPADGWSCPQAENKLGAAVQLRAARNCAVERCTITRTGGYGLWFGNDCADGRIAGNHLHDLGGGGIRVGTTDKLTPDRMAQRMVIDNNYVHDGGLEHPGAVGIYQAYGHHNRITHNEVSDLRYTGISLGWTWDTVMSGTRDNLVADNHVHHVMRVLEDGGGIYSLGFTPGSVIRHNHIHDIGNPSDPVGHGIYLDGGSAGVLCEQNLVHDCGTAGIRNQHGTSGLTILNNISAYCQVGLGIDSERTNIYQRNIIYLAGEGQPFSYVPVWKSYDKIIDYNLYWHEDGRPLKFLSFTFDEWRKKQGLTDIWYTPRMDPHSRVADPKFVDPQARDFHLQPDSPALAVGFEPFPLDGFGLYGDPDWVALPNQYAPRPLDDNEKVLGLSPIDDDFERYAPGDQPGFCALHEDPGKGTIRVSAERAAAGQQSLKFVDLAGQQSYHQPHLYYSPRMTGDLTVKMTFDLFREPGAMIWTEWRNTPSYAKVGPCLFIDADGRLLLQNRTPTDCVLPSGQWLHFELVDGLGKLSDAKWRLRITSGDQVLYEADDLPCDPEFTRILWLGLVSYGTEPAVFYLDNLRVAAE